jgi:hypothetical protein
VKARAAHLDKERAGVPLSKTFNDHVLTIMQSDARNPEVQNAYDRLLARDPKGRSPQVSFSGNEANPFFHRDGEGFVEIGTTLGISRREDGRGFVLVDLDQDGALDVVLHNHLKNPVVALVNRAAEGNRWLRVRLRGVKSNRFGVGARVTVTASSRRQSGELACGSGYLSCPPPELHFGMGKDEQADVTVRWPSGQVDEHKGLAAGRVYTFTEGAAGAVRAEEIRRLEIGPTEAAPAAPAELDVAGVLGNLETLDGRRAGVGPEGKPVIAVFFSVSCNACRSELLRVAELEKRAGEAGAALAWVTVDADPKAVAAELRKQAIVVKALKASAPLGPVPVPLVYLVAPGRPEKFTGRFAVEAALEAAARLKK